MNNKTIMGVNIQRYINKVGISRKDFAKAIGVPYSSLTDWINGKSYPRIEKIELMAQFFGVQKSDLVEDSSINSGEQSSYAAQKILNDPYYRILFDAALDSMPEDILMAAEMLQRIKNVRLNGGDKRHSEEPEN